MPVSGKERAKKFRDNLRENDPERLKQIYKQKNDRRREKYCQNYAEVLVQRNFARLLEERERKEIAKQKERERERQKKQITKQQKIAAKHSVEQQKVAAQTLHVVAKQSTKQQKIATKETTQQQKVAGAFTNTSGKGGHVDELSIPRKAKAAAPPTQELPSLIAGITPQYPNQSWRQRGQIMLPLTHDKDTIEVNCDEDECVVRWARETLHKLMETYLPGVKKGDFGDVLDDVMDCLTGKKFKRALRSLNVERNGINHHKWGYVLRDRAYYVQTFQWVLQKLAPGYQVVHRNLVAEELQKQLAEKDEQLAEKDEQLAEKDAEIARLLRQVAELENNQVAGKKRCHEDALDNALDEDDEDEDDDDEFEFDPSRLGMEEEDEYTHVDKRQRTVE